MEELKKDTVRMKDPENVKNLISQIIAGGKDQLQVIADFDKTLSKYMHDGRIVPTCHNALLISEKMPPKFRNVGKELLAKYQPIEVDPKMTIEEKLPYMIEWWTQAHKVLIDCNMSRVFLLELVEDANILLRDGSKWMFEALHEADVPLLIFSAGLGDIIKLTLTKLDCPLYDNMKVVSNYMTFDEQDKLVGFQEDLIHVFNKNESSIHDSDYFTKLKGRENIILLGDSMGDLRMAEGANAKILLKIGFLNEKIEERLSAYMDAFDIVLVSDETLQIPNALMKRVLKM